MDWCRDTVLLFLNLIRERPVIWDMRNQNYKDKQKKYAAIEEIALLMGCSVKMVNTKWTSLKNQYSREKRNMTGMRTGSGADAIYTTKWYAYKEMESLMDGNTPELTYNNFSESSCSPPTPRPPSTPTPPLLQTPSTPTPPLLPTPSTPTPPLPSTPIPPAKRTKINRNSIFSEAMETIKTIRQDRATRRNEFMINEPSPSNSDDLASFGLYVAAQLRKFNPRLQCKGKNEISKILYMLEIQSLDDITSGIDFQNLKETNSKVTPGLQETAQNLMNFTNEDHDYFRAREIERVFSYDGTEIELPQSTSNQWAETEHISE